MIPARPATVNVFEKKNHGVKMNGIDVELTERFLSHPRGNTSRDICEVKEVNNSCEDRILKPESNDSDGGITYLN